MNRILIDAESWSLLDKWRAENAGYVKFAGPYFQDVEMHLVGTGGVAYAQWKKDKWKINIKVNGKIYATIHIEEPEDEKHEFMLRVNKKTENINDDYIRNLVTIFLTTNSYLTYGNLSEDRPVVLLGKNDGEDKVITFRAFQGRTYAVCTRAHRSPEGVFGVRGHFRHNRNGTVTWIDEYLKGVEKDKK